MVPSKVSVKRIDPAKTLAVNAITRSMTKRSQPQTSSGANLSTRTTMNKPYYVIEGEENDSTCSTPGSLSDSSSTSSIAPLMMTNASTIDEQLASIMKAIEGLSKHVQDQETRISHLMNKADHDNASRTNGKQVEEPNYVEGSTKHQAAETEFTEKDFQISSDGGINIGQLKELILGTIKDKYDEGSKSSFTNTKPYTKRVDNLRMPTGYQPPKFQQFDGKGNLKQHVAHFVETCNHAGTYGDHLAKKFLMDHQSRSLESSETNNKSTKGEIQNLEARLNEKETENKIILEAKLEIEAIKSKLREALMKVGCMTEEVEKSNRNAVRVAEQLQAVQADHAVMEAELRELMPLITLVGRLTSLYADLDGDILKKRRIMSECEDADRVCAEKVWCAGEEAREKRRKN
ncbi:hypothetical protein OROMI_004971 [Orobanche minor]